MARERLQPSRRRAPAALQCGPVIVRGAASLRTSALHFNQRARRPTIESRYGTERSAVNDRTLLTLSSDASVVHA